jgi:hypothetical protein
MSTTSYRDEVIAWLPSVIPTGFKVRPGEGRFTPQDKANKTFPDYSVVVSLLGLTMDTMTGGTPQATATMEAAIIVRVGRGTVSPHDVAADCAGLIMRALYGKRFNASTSCQSNIKSVNAHQWTLDGDQGMTAVWALQWSASIELPVLTNPTLNYLKRIDTTFVESDDATPDVTGRVDFP